jgi:hypothetical protein
MPGNLSMLASRFKGVPARADCDAKITEVQVQVQDFPPSPGGGLKMPRTGQRNRRSRAARIPEARTRTGTATTHPK